VNGRGLFGASVLMLLSGAAVAAGPAAGPAVATPPVAGAPAKTLPEPAQAVREVLASPHFQFCHEPSYPLTPAEKAWCDLGAGENPQACTKLREACKNDALAKQIELIEAELPSVEQIIIGARPCDAASLPILDRIFNGTTKTSSTTNAAN